MINVNFGLYRWFGTVYLVPGATVEQNNDAT